MKEVTAYQSWDGILYTTADEAQMADQCHLRNLKLRAINEITDGDSSTAKRVIEEIIDHSDAVMDVLMAQTPEGVEQELGQWATQLQEQDSRR